MPLWSRAQQLQEIIKIKIHIWEITVHRLIGQKAGEWSVLMISNTVHAALISQISKPLQRIQEDHISSTVYILLIVHIPHTETNTGFAGEWKCPQLLEHKFWEDFPKDRNNVIVSFGLILWGASILTGTLWKKSVVYMRCVTSSCQILLHTFMREWGETPGPVTFFYTSSTEMSAVCQINMSFQRLGGNKVWDGSFTD